MNFDLDMTNRELVMYFDETVRETTLNVTQLAFLADVSAVSTIPPVWLTSNSVLQRQVNDTVIAITIGVLDMNSIKAAGSTAIGAASTFLAGVAFMQCSPAAVLLERIEYTTDASKGLLHLVRV